jgi:hypothetical protein
MLMTSRFHDAVSAIETIEQGERLVYYTSRHTHHPQLAARVSISAWR